MHSQAISRAPLSLSQESLLIIDVYNVVRVTFYLHLGTNESTENPDAFTQTSQYISMYMVTKINNEYQLNAVSGT